MSSDNPGFFGRIKRVISGTLNSAVESVSDPGQEVALMLDDLSASIKQAERDLVQAAAERKVLEKKCEQESADVATWERRAEQALREGNEALARAALSQRVQSAETLSGTQTHLAEQTVLVEKMKGEIEAARQKLKTLNLRRGTLMNQARAVKQSVSVDGIASAGTGRIDAIEAKIAELEAKNEVIQELRSDADKEAEVAAAFRKLDAATGVDDQLAALKAKLAATKSLSSGESS